MKTILRSKDLSCPSCITTIEKDLNNREGVENATVHFTTGRIEVRHNPDTISGKDLAKAVTKLGYETSVSAF